jgi:hypothetical protein
MSDFDEPVTELVRMDNEGEDLFLVLDVPIGEFQYNRFIPPDYTRGTYVENRRHSKHFVEGVNYAPTKSNKIIHIGEPYENYYSEEFRLALEELARKIPFTLRISRRRRK